MAVITIFKNEQITISYYPDKKIIHHVMHKYTYGQTFREALLAGAEAMKTYQAHKWLSDDRNNPVLSPEDQKWGIEVWEPQVIAAGWKYWAIVQPEHAIAKWRMLKLAEMYSKKGITVQLFTDPDEAMKWLESQ